MNQGVRTPGSRLKQGPTSNSITQRDPELFFGQALLWRPGVPRPKNHTLFRDKLIFGHAAEGGKAKQLFVSENVWFFCLGTPGLPKTTWPTQTLRGLFDITAAPEARVFPGPVCTRDQGIPETTKPYEFIGLGVMDVTRPYEFIGFGAMYVTKPHGTPGTWMYLGAGCPWPRPGYTPRAK